MPLHRGFIALISALLISTVLLGLAATLCMSSLFARLDALSQEYHRVALGLAESCAQVALLKVAQNYAYDPTVDADYVSGRGVYVLVGTDGQGISEACSIASVSFALDPSRHRETATIMTRGQYRNSFAGVRVQALVADPTFAPSHLVRNVLIVSWTEVP